MRKKILSLVVVLCFLLNMGTTTTLAVGVDYMNWDNSDLAVMIGTTVDDVQYTKEVYGSNFNSVLADYLKRTSQPIARSIAFTEDPQAILADAETGDVHHNNPKTRMQDDSWTFMKETFRKGQILVSKDSKRL